MALVKRILTNQAEDIADFRYVDHKSILMPASKILIGTGNTLGDADFYQSSVDLTMDLTFGAANLGLDTGTEVQDQWYAVYAVPGSNGSYGLRFSVNPPPQAGGTGPVGFTKYRYLGLIRNGGNAWDATNGSYGRGDIARFTKNGNMYFFQTVNSTNGGVYPAAIGVQGLVLGIANSSTNGPVMDLSLTGNFGLTGLSSNGQVKLPYTTATYQMDVHCNGQYANSYVRLTDSVGNDRQYWIMNNIANTNTTRSVPFTVQKLLNGVTWNEVIQVMLQTNPNVSRCTSLLSMIDPYVK